LWATGGLALAVVVAALCWRLRSSHVEAAAALLDQPGASEDLLLAPRPLAAVEQAIQDGNAALAQRLLRGHLANPNAADREQAVLLLREVELATSDAKAIELLAELSTEALNGFNSGGRLSFMEQVSNEALQQIYAATLRRHLPREQARREEVRHRHEAEQRLAKVEEDLRGLKDQVARDTRRQQVQEDPKKKEETLAKPELEKKPTQSLSPAKASSPEEKKQQSQVTEMQLMQYTAALPPAQQKKCAQALRLLQVVHGHVVGGTLTKKVANELKSKGPWEEAKRLLAVSGDYIPPGGQTLMTLREAWEMAAPLLGTADPAAAGANTAQAGSPPR
jgi:hypothetical protein